MKTNNFKRMKCDPNLTVLNSFFCVLCYVDDLMVFGSDSDVFQLAQDLGMDLLVKTTGELSEGKAVTFLGRQIKRNADSIELFMCTSYVDLMLDELNMRSCKPTWTPGGTSKPQETQGLQETGRSTFVDVQCT